MLRGRTWNVNRRRGKGLDDDLSTAILRARATPAQELEQRIAQEAVEDADYERARTAHVGVAATRRKARDDALLASRAAAADLKGISPECIAAARDPTPLASRIEKASQRKATAVREAASIDLTTYREGKARDSARADKERWLADSRKYDEELHHLMELEDKCPPDTREKVARAASARARLALAKAEHNAAPAAIEALQEAFRRKQKPLSLRRGLLDPSRGGPRVIRWERETSGLRGNVTSVKNPPPTPVRRIKTVRELHGAAGRYNVIAPQPKLVFPDAPRPVRIASRPIERAPRAYVSGLKPSPEEESQYRLRPPPYMDGPVAMGGSATLQPVAFV